MSIEKCLQYLDLAEYADGGLKLRKASLLLFASDPQKWHPRLQIRIIKVNGNEIKTGAEYNVTADDSISGNILVLLEKGWEGLRPHLVQTTLRENARFESRVMYPEYACREALVNAIAHRDYSQEGRGIEIYVYTDRMEVVNPGALLSTITVDDLCRLEGVHQSRNSLISRVLRELGYMRELGEGVRRIFELMTSNELAAPELKSTKESFSITLHHKPLYSQKDLIWLEQFAPFNLERELKAVVLLGREGNIFSPKDIWDALGIVDTEHYRRVVDSLQKARILINEVSPVQAKSRASRQRIPTREFPRFKVVVPDSPSVATTVATGQKVHRKATPASAPPTIPKSDLSESNAKIYVGNLAIDVTKSDLFDLFSDHGEVIEIHIPMNGTHNNGYAFVEFSTPEQALSAISKLDNFLYKERTLKLREYNPKPRNPAPAQRNPKR